MLSFLITAAVSGSIYALVAGGFTMIFGVAGVVNLGHGALLLSGPYAFIISRGILGLPTVPSVIISLIAGAGVALLLERMVSTIKVDTTTISVNIVLFVASLAMQAIVMLKFSEPRILPPLTNRLIRIAGASVTGNEVLAVGTSLASFLLLGCFVRYTRVGLSIKATSMSLRGAALIGIDVRLMSKITWTISGILAALGGVFLGVVFEASPAMWVIPLSISFAVVVTGGLGNVTGSLIAAYLIAVVETLTVYQTSVAYQGLSSLLIIIIFLLVKPQGILAKGR